jgi:MATE family multidrug resistance protein
VRDGDAHAARERAASAGADAGLHARAQASGIGSGVNTRVGNELGAGQGAAARLACLAALLAVAATQSSTAVGAWLLRHQLLAVFTDSGEVTAATLGVMPVLSLSFLTDGLNAVLGGVLRGAGQQKMGAALNLLGYWLVALPLALLLGFRAGLGAVARLAPPRPGWAWCRWPPRASART